jgi:hypothetical protein
MDPIELACKQYGITKESGIFNDIVTSIKNRNLGKGLTSEARQNFRPQSSLHQFEPNKIDVVQHAKNMWNNLTPNQQLGAVGAAGLGAGYMYGNSNNSR